MPEGVVAQESSCDVTSGTVPWCKLKDNTAPSYSACKLLGAVEI